MPDDPLSGYEEVDDPEFERKFGRKPRRNQAQYELLLECSRARNNSAWNMWRKKDYKEQVWLEGANLKLTHLKGVSLISAHLKGADLAGAHLEAACMNNALMGSANLPFAHMEGAGLCNADLEEANLKCSFLRGSKLIHANLKNAHLDDARMEGASLQKARMEEATLIHAKLKSAHLDHAHMEGAKLRDAHLEGAILTGAHLEDADLTCVGVDGETVFWDCTVDKNTDFSGVGMGSCRMSPGLRDTLEYNIRRTRSEEGNLWRQLWNLPMNLFWYLSDYGRSTRRIGLFFLLLSVLFAWVYESHERRGVSLVRPLSPAALDPDADPRLRPCRAIYFSVVTMTTLGFGDMNANPDSIRGHIILSFQVMIGYLLLGALICRFGIYFQSHGPPVPLSRTWKPSKNKLDS
jgi:uncharacterized protein YjbI with pentapeptide repeats